MMHAVRQAISEAMKQIRQSYFGIVTRASTLTAGQAVQISGLTDELIDGVPVIQHVGFVSGVPKGSRVVVLPLMGKTMRVVAIASDGAQTMVQVNEGETSIFDQYGHSVLLSADGVSIKGDTGIQGNGTVSGNLTVGNGANGVFTTPLGQIVTVVNGIVTNIF